MLGTQFTHESLSTGARIHIKIDPPPVGPGGTRAAAALLRERLATRLLPSARPPRKATHSACIASIPPGRHAYVQSELTRGRSLGTRHWQCGAVTSAHAGWLGEPAGPCWNRALRAPPAVVPLRAIATLCLEVLRHTQGGVSGGCLLPCFSPAMLVSCMSLIIYIVF